MALIGVTSCGSTNPGPAVATFKTVTVTATAVTPLTPVSVFTGSTCSNDVRTGVITITNTALSVALTSTLYTTTGTVTGEPVTINGYSISYRPLNGGPAISDPVGGGFTATIPPGGSVTAPVLISSFKTEGVLQNDPTLQKCAPNNYDYDVTITFFGTELSGANASIPVHTTLTYTNSI